MKMEYVLSGITLIIGAFVAFVGYQQYLVNRERFKLDLFEKRFAVYKVYRSFFRTGDDIPNYIGQIDRAALELMSTTDGLNDIPVGEERSRMAQKKAEQIKSLVAQLPKLGEVFGPYLKLRSWK
jgi:hypothetical protein